VIKRIRKIATAILTVMLSLLIIVWGASFIVLPWQVNKQLAPHQLMLGDKSSMSFNPFTLQLAINQLTIVDDKGAVQSSLEHAHVNLSWTDLVSSRLVIESSLVKSLSLNAQRTSEHQLIVSGIAIPAQQEVTETPEPTEQSTSLEQSAIANWQLLLPKLSLVDVVVNVDDNGHKQQLAINSLDVLDVDVTLARQSLSLVLAASINQATVKLDTKIQANDSLTKTPKIVVDNQFSLTDFNTADWQYLVPLESSGVDDVAGKITLSLNNHIDLSGQQWTVTQPSLRLVLDEILVNQAGLSVMNNQLAFDLTQLEVSGERDKLKALSANAMLTIDDVDVTSEGNTLAKLARLELPSLELAVNQQLEVDATAAKLSLGDIVFSRLQSNDNALYHSQGVVVKDIAWRANHLAIDTIGLKEFSSEVLLATDKSLKNLVVIPQQEQAPVSDEVSEPTTTDAEAQANQPQITVSLNTLELLTPSKIKIVDESVKPVFEQTVLLEKVSLAAIDSRELEQMSSFAIALSLDKHARASADGTVAPFGDAVNMTLNSQLSEFSLPPLSSYLRSVLGFDFLSGQLDNKVTLVVKQSKLDGETVIDLRGFELASGNDTTDLSVGDGSAIGLNSALNMLKDGQGNVSLSVPLSGDINDPSFGMSSVLTLVAQKAIMSQAKSYLINTFVPYANVVTVASMAGEYLLRLEMNDLEYMPLQISLSEPQSVFVTELAALLKDKPEQQVKMCAIAGIDEITESSTMEQKTAALRELSKQRGEALKSELVDIHMIESARLLLCAPKIDSEAGSTPRVEFSF